MVNLENQNFVILCCIPLDPLVDTEIGLFVMNSQDI